MLQMSIACHWFIGRLILSTCSLISYTLQIVVCGTGKSGLHLCGYLQRLHPPTPLLVELCCPKRPRQRAGAPTLPHPGPASEQPLTAMAKWKWSGKKQRNNTYLGKEKDRDKATNIVEIIGNDHTYWGKCNTWMIFTQPSYTSHHCTSIPPFFLPQKEKKTYLSYFLLPAFCLVRYCHGAGLLSRPRRHAAVGRTKDLPRQRHGWHRDTVRR